MTFTETTQFKFGVTVALVKLTVLPPATAFSTAAPPQFVKGVPPNGGLARTTFAGKVSVNEVPVRSVSVSLLLIVMVRVLTSPMDIVFGANPLLSVGGVTATTVNVALAGVVLEIVTTVPLSFPLALKLSAGMVLMRFPAVVDVTLIST